MNKLSFSRALKLHGNTNRLLEFKGAGRTVEDARKFFASEGVHLVVVNGDVPLLANLPELTRVAVSKDAVKRHLRKMEPSALPFPPAIA